MTQRLIRKIALAAMLAGGAGLAFAAGTAPRRSVDAGEFRPSMLTPDPTRTQVTDTAAATLQYGSDLTDSKVIVVQQQVIEVNPGDPVINSWTGPAPLAAYPAMIRGGRVMGAWQVSQTVDAYNAGGGEGGTWVPATVTYTGGPCVSGWGVNYGPLGMVYTGRGQEVADRRLDKACPPGSGNISP